MQIFSKDWASDSLTASFKKRDYNGGKKSLGQNTYATLIDQCRYTAFICCMNLRDVI